MVQSQEETLGSQFKSGSPCPPDSGLSTKMETRPSRVTLQRELAEDVIPDIKPLVAKHYEEIAHYKDIPLSVTWDAYLEAEKLGALRVFTARDPSGVLIGYSIYFIKHNIHYNTSLQAVQDVLYVDSARRGFGMRLIKWCDEQLAAEGVQAVYHHMKVKHDFGPLLERLGYELVDLVYGRRLD